MPCGVYKFSCKAVLRQSDRCILLDLTPERLLETTMSFDPETFEALFDFESLSRSPLNTIDDLFAWDADGDFHLAFDNHVDIGSNFDFEGPPVEHDPFSNKYAFINSAKLDFDLASNVSLEIQSCLDTQCFEQALPKAAEYPKEQIDHDVEEPPIPPVQAITRCSATRPTTRPLAAGPKKTTLDAKPNNEGRFLVFSAFENHPRKLSSRRRLDPIRRKEVHAVRKIGSCVRCQLSKKSVCLICPHSRQFTRAKPCLDQCGPGEPCPPCSALGQRLLDQPCIRENLAARAVYHQCEPDGFKWEG